MLANTDRSRALAFGDLVDQYDAGRPRLPVEFVDRVAQRCDLSATGEVLEVGAGTGQLTDALLASGRSVTALEPSVPMAERLRQRHRSQIDAGQLSVVPARFEEANGTGYTSIWSSDAWHWVDPTVSYSSAAKMLQPGGCLIAMWTLTAVPDGLDLADALNDAYAELSPDLIRDPRNPIDETLTLAGREQIEASGVMTVTDHWTEDTTIVPMIEEFADWQLSFAQIAAMPSAQRRRLRDAILRTARRFNSSDTIPVIVHRYVVVSRPVAPSASTLASSGGC